MVHLINAVFYDLLSWGNDRNCIKLRVGFFNVFNYLKNKYVRDILMRRLILRVEYTLVLPVNNDIER